MSAPKSAWSIVIIILLSHSASRAVADTAARLNDIGMRVSYGFYSEEPGVVAAAADELRRMAESPDVQYVRALAALRVQQLWPATAAGDKDTQQECHENAVAATASDVLAAEAWVLIAACADLAARGAPLKSMLQQRRRDDALARARALDEDNPRAAWVAAWSEIAPAASAGRRIDARGLAQLEAVVAAFRAYDGAFDAPAWGEAEALVHYGAALLDAGDVRRARDVLEEALLVAPGYQAALRQMARVQGR